MKGSSATRRPASAGALRTLGEQAPSLGWVRMIQALFFVSGAPALMYQIVWQRTLFRVFGVNIEAITIVVTAFMLGLGLGSLAGGWLSRQRRMPLLPLLAAIEMLTAVFGLVSIRLIEHAGHAAIGLPLFGTAAVTLMVVIVPTLLMGATLPIVVGHLAPKLGDVGRTVGQLYFVNTLGAAAACFALPLMVFPFAGMNMAISLAVVINVCIAGVALLAHARHGETAPVAHAELSRSEPSRAHLSLGAAACFAAASGFVALSFEIFYIRIASFADGGGAWSFALTLGVFLLGIAAGAHAVGDACRAQERAALRSRVLANLFLGCVAAAASLPLIAAVASFPPLVTSIQFVFVFLVARAWGMVLPYVADASIAVDGHTGPRTSLLYLANILGSAAGSLITGFVLMDRLGIVAIAQLLVTVGLAVSLALALTPRAGGPGAGGVLAPITVVGMAVLALPGLAPRFLERLQFKGGNLATEPFTVVIENRSGIVAVDHTGTVWGHGSYDGRFNTSLGHDTNGILRPYALSLFHEKPRHVLMIGLASGSWARVIASNQDVETLTIVEINKAYLEVAATSEEVRSVLTDPKIRIVIDDGRRWLARHPNERFDAIVQNTTFHYRANITNLLSREYLGVLRDHLRPGGVAFYNTTGSARVQRTACAEAAHGLRFANHMLISNDPIRLDFERWRATLERYRIDGRPVVEGDDGRVLLDRLMALELRPSKEGSAATIESCASVLRRTRGLEPVTDDNMGSEWRAPLGLE